MSSQRSKDQVDAMAEMKTPCFYQELDTQLIRLIRICRWCESYIGEAIGKKTFFIPFAGACNPRLTNYFPENPSG
jgi:hypothetical protein